MGFLLIIGWGESGKASLQVNIAVLWVLSQKISGKDGSAPLEKLAHTPMPLTKFDGGLMRLMMTQSTD